MSRIQKRIQELIDKLKSGHDVQRRDMKSVMTTKEIDEFDAQWKIYLDEKHGSWHVYSDGYEKWLKKGDMLVARANSERFKNSKASLLAQSEKCYGEAYANLANDIALNQMVQHSYDRSIDDVGATFDTMARRKTSKSTYNESREHKTLEKRDFKIRALQESLDNFERRGNEDSDVQSQAEKLKELMTQLKNRK